MRYDCLIIGGGLSGLTCGIALAKKGKRVGILAGGQSTLHFNAGSLELLARTAPDAHDTLQPLNAIGHLPESHPYRLIGQQAVGQYASQAQQLLADAGLPTQGNADTNHFRITPIGVFKPAWLTLNDIATAQQPEQLPWKKVTLLAIDGYIDFATHFVAHGLQQAGAHVDIRTIGTEALAAARRSATEMRATSIAKVLENSTAIRQLAEKIRQAVEPDSVGLIPAVFGLESNDAFDRLRQLAGVQLLQLPTMPPCTPGTRIANLLRHYFRMLGGTYLLGDSATKADLSINTLNAVYSNKLGDDIPLHADHFVLATGSFVSKGLVADYNHIYEPLLGLDVNAPEQRKHWTTYGLLNAQPYQQSGVIVDNQLHPQRNGQCLQNVYAIGQVLAGADPINLGAQGGISLITALAAADSINRTP